MEKSKILQRLAGEEIKRQLGEEKIERAKASITELFKSDGIPVNRSTLDAFVLGLVQTNLANKSNDQELIPLMWAVVSLMRTELQDKVEAIKL